MKENRYLIFDRDVSILKMIARRIVYYPYNIINVIANSLIHPKITRKKYYCSICAIFRDEANYLKEWIEYHLIIGVDHFYLYNNFSEDEYMDVLKPYIDSGIVTLCDWTIEHGQMLAYQDCYDKYRNETNWIAYIDLDEYIVPNIHNNINDFLADYSKYPGIVIYWKYFGSSGLIERNPERLISEDFTVCWRKYADIGKMVFNTEYLYQHDYKFNSYMHLMWGEYKGLHFAPVNPYKKRVMFNVNRVRTQEHLIQVNHYVVKSYKEYVDKKSKRGGGVHDISMHSLDYFFNHESFCGDSDYHIYKYLIKLKLAMKNEIGE